MRIKEKNKRFFNPSIFPKSRKGLFLAEETLKIVIAVIVIAFLVYFLVSLYFSNRNAEEMKFAQESLTYLAEQINLKSAEVNIYNPDGWSILSWPYGGKMPLSCFNLGWKNCLCICDKPFIATNENYLENCDETGSSGICVESSFSVIGDGSQQPIIIENPPVTIKIDYGNKTISPA